MKKIISLCAVVLSLVVLVTMFTACGDKNNEPDVTTDESVGIVETGFSAVVEKDKAIVKKDGKTYQELEFPKNSGVKFNKKYATKNNEFIDMNFDGKKDFYIAVSSVDGVISYYCWLYNDSTKKFEYSVILSELKNISVDAENQKILSSVEVDGEKHVLSYTWVDGQLVLDTDYSDENGGIPENVTQSVTNNAIGTDKPTKPSKTEATTKKNTSDASSDKTTTPSKKPANTTPTKPSGGGVVLETGSLNSGGWY